MAASASPWAQQPAPVACGLVMFVDFGPWSVVVRGFLAPFPGGEGRAAYTDPSRCTADDETTCFAALCSALLCSAQMRGDLGARQYLKGRLPALIAVVIDCCEPCDLRYFY